jgi:hypothetical protein
MTKQRKHFRPEEKVAILRRHLAEKVPVSTACEEAARPVTPAPLAFRTGWAVAEPRGILEH